MIVIMTATATAGATGCTANPNPNTLSPQARPKLGISSVGHGSDAREAKQRTSKSAWL